MKKRTLALALMLMAFSMTACGKTQIEDTVAETASDTASGVVSDTVTSVDVSETIKDETQTETEAETTAETKADISLPSLVKPEAEETTTASESVTETEKESASEKALPGVDHIPFQPDDPTKPAQDCQDHYHQQCGADLLQPPPGTIGNVHNMLLISSDRRAFLRKRSANPLSLLLR